MALPHADVTVVNHHYRRAVQTMRKGAPQDDGFAAAKKEA
jgi:hypothetical protein